MKDVEVLLRGFALMIDGDNYAPSMVTFLNQFSRKCRAMTDDQLRYLSDLLDSFLAACKGLSNDAFLNKKNRRFNVALYEAAFAAICGPAFRKERMLKGMISAEKLAQLENDSEFLTALVEGTTQTKNVKIRIKRARAILGSY